MRDMVCLIPMTEDVFKAYVERGTISYAEENVKAGYWLAAEALGKSRQAYEKLLPEGIATEGHYLYSIEEVEHGREVGILWLAVRRGTARPSGFVYDLCIDERFRRRGYATQAMRVLEGKARELGLEAIALHVFTHNPAAVGLYKNLGYDVRSINMVKELSLGGEG